MIIPFTTTTFYYRIDNNCLYFIDIEFKNNKHRSKIENEFRWKKKSDCSSKRNEKNNVISWWKGE